MSFHTLRIAAVARDTDDAVAVTFAIPSALREAFAFRPGQYLTLRARIGGAEVRRPYSICSAPGDAGLTVGIKRVEGGVFSTFAQTLAPGDTLEAMPPEGRFGTLAPAAGRILAIAAGSGITPILSILRHALETHPEAQAVLLYGNRTTPGIMFRTALDDLKDRHLHRLTVLHCLSREAQDLPALNGRLDGARIAALLPALLPAAEIDAAFLCGPGGLTDAAAGALAGLGVPASRIQAEHFTPASPPRPPATAPAGAPARSATIIADGKTTTIEVAPGEAILDAALRAGLDLPWSCHGGMCSTCRARLVEGAATMEQNFSLEPWETEAGYVLTCQARPDTAHVTVDYDHV